MFKETVDRLLGDLVTPDLVNAAETGSWPAALWSAIEENGLPLAAVPEDAGGVGGDWSDCFDIAASAGAHAAPVPLADTMAANRLLGRAGATPPAGAVVLGVAETDAAADKFTGIVRDVAWGRFATHVLVSTGARLLLLARDAATVTAAANVAGEPRDTLVFDTVAPVLAIESPAGPKAVMLAGAAIRSAQIAGALGRLLTISVDYAGQREQFGRPIAKFQAVQQQLAVLAEQAMMARSAAEAAFFEPDPDRVGFATAVAKQVTSEAAGSGASIAHAVLGAIGFTHEFTLHLLTRRLWSWRSEFGSARFWADRIGDVAYNAGSENYWSRLVQSGFTIAAGA